MTMTSGIFLHLGLHLHLHLVLHLVLHLHRRHHHHHCRMMMTLECPSWKSSLCPATLPKRRKCYEEPWQWMLVCVRREKPPAGFTVRPVPSTLAVISGWRTQGSSCRRGHHPKAEGEAIRELNPGHLRDNSRACFSV
jgi:hypothetical protein